MKFNENVQTSTENQQSTNDNHNYDNRRSYNNLPLHEGECLVPIRVDWEMVKHFNMCQDNLETWHIGPNKVLVAFAPIAIEGKAAALKQFNADVREHFASFKTDDILSLDQFMDEVSSAKGLNLHHLRTLKKLLYFVWLFRIFLKRFMSLIRSMVAFWISSAKITPKDRFLKNYNSVSLRATPTSRPHRSLQRSSTTVNKL